MEMPQPWHRRHALTLASQLPENVADARLILYAVTELVEGFLSRGEEAKSESPNNVVPFTGTN